MDIIPNRVLYIYLFAQIQRHNKTNPDFTIAIGQLIINSNHYYVKTQKYQAHTVTKLTNLGYYIYHVALHTFTLFLLTTFDIHVIVMLYDLGAVITGTVSGSLHWCAMLFYAMLCYAMLCYAMLCYAMLCYVMLCYMF